MVILTLFFSFLQRNMVTLEPFFPKIYILCTSHSHIFLGSPKWWIFAQNKNNGAFTFGIPNKFSTMQKRSKVIGFKIQNIIGKTNIFQQEKYFWVNVFDIFSFYHVMLHLIHWHITLRSTTLLSFATHGFSSSLKISDFFCNEFPLVCVFYMKYLWNSNQNLELN